MAIAASNGNEGARNNLDRISEGMNEDQLATAIDLAKAFVPQPVVEEFLRPEGPQG